MKKYYIVKVDIGSKQKYIFSSNKLKEIIGASEVIRFITEELGKEVLNCMGKKSYEFDGENDGNILFEAGGNSMYIFDDIDDAKRFNEIFSKFVMRYFDGIELLMVIHEFDINSKLIVDVFEDIENKVTVKKGKRKNQFKRIGYGLTQICQRTGKPAGYFIKEDNKNVIISKESNDKLSFYENLLNNKNYTKEYVLEDKILKIKGYDYKEKFIELYGKESIGDFDFTNELNKVAGEVDEGSYIGITCIDGNGMGRKLSSFFNQKLKEKESVFEFNKTNIREYRTITEQIKSKYINTFFSVLKETIDNHSNYCKEIKLEDNIIPIRPIILAGDDITFISNGKLALEVTRIFTEKITNEKVDFLDKKYNLTVSAGVAIVKRNYPFSRAVQLSSQLEKNSKKRLKEIKDNFEKLKTKYHEEYIEYDASLIGWQIDRGNTLEEISYLRDNSLTTRPYVIDIEDKKFNILKQKITNDNEYFAKKYLSFSFDHFDKVLKSVNEGGMKSKFKNFFRTMNSSEIDTELFLLKYNIGEKVNSDMLKGVLYDAIDIVDLYTYIKEDF